MKIVTTALACCALALSTGVMAETINGTVDATLTVQAGCLINGAAQGGTLDLGSLNFGTHSAFTDLDATMTGGGANSAITVQCTDGVSYTVTLIDSANVKPTIATGLEGTTARYLNNAGDAYGVAYQIYSDSGFGSVIANGAPLTGTPDGNGVNSYTLYGRITDANSALLTADTYTDTINIAITY